MTKGSLLFLIGVAWLLESGAALRAQGREIAILERAHAALNEAETRLIHWAPYNPFMLAQLRKAEGIAIFPGMFKAAAGIGGRHGRGVLLVREADGSWGPPVFVELSGASVGIQLGIGRTDLVLALRTRSNPEQLKQGKLTLGVDNMLAVGPIGVEHVLAADTRLKACIVSPSSPSRGLYAGWSVEGNRLKIDAAATAAYQQYEQNRMQQGGPMGSGTPSPSLRLQMRLAELSAAPPAPHLIEPYR
jgi:SH3 domain-containing YSC84-like protein 1